MSNLSHDDLDKILRSNAPQVPLIQSEEKLLLKERVQMLDVQRARKHSTWVWVLSAAASLLIIFGGLSLQLVDHYKEEQELYAFLVEDLGDLQFDRMHSEESFFFEVGD